MTPTETLVTMQHVRAAGFCAKGARRFALHHGLDWRAFRKAGLKASTLEATGDALALAVVAKAREPAHG